MRTLFANLFRAFFDCLAVVLEDHVAAVGFGGVEGLIGSGKDGFGVVLFEGLRNAAADRDSCQAGLNIASVWLPVSLNRATAPVFESITQIPVDLLWPAVASSTRPAMVRCKATP